MSVSDISQLLFAGGIFINAVLAGLTYLKTVRSAKNISLLEINTNSIKDALVKATGELEHAKGVIQGRAAEQSDIAKR